jgi:L-ribulose-5-phosphate 3-epimerase
MNRRNFVLSTLAAPLAAQAASKRPPLILFSKHLQKLNYPELAKALRQLGYEGVDLTVRPAGHVLPEKVGEDLPRAADAMRAEGLSIPMITTGLLSASDPAARPTLSTAARLRIPYFKLGYWRYKTPGVEGRMAEVRKDLNGLVELAKEYGIQAGFHNHSGDYVGSPVWDIREITTGMDPRWVGYYFDPCHATAEGGSAGWRLSFDIAVKRLKMIALKDFYWDKSGGKWRMKMCPLGQGMVDWPRFFSMLAQSGFAGPISVHVEYDPHDEMDASARDLAFVQQQMKTTYGG